MFVSCSVVETATRRWSVRLHRPPGCLCFPFSCSMAHYLPITCTACDCVCPAMHARCWTERFCNLCVLFLETHCIQTFIQLKGKKRENMNLATVQMCPDGQMTSERPCVLCGSVDPWPSALTFIWSSRLNRGFQADQQTETQTTVLFLRLFWSADPNAIVQCVAQSEVSEGIKVRGVQRNFWVRFVLTSALRGFSFISWK